MNTLTPHRHIRLWHQPKLQPFQNPPRLKVKSLRLFPLNSSNHNSDSTSTSISREGAEQGIPNEDVRTLARFQSRHNNICVLQVSRRADHPLAGTRLLLLDKPGNIHSISHLFNPLTSSYLDVFATLPPIIPSGPIAILGFGAGSAARLILHLYPKTIIHGYELDPSVISVAREFFSLSKLEQQYRNQLSIFISDAIQSIPTLEDGFYSGILVDLYLKGSVITQLQDTNTWKELKKKIHRNGRIMVNCGGRCVESEDPRRDGDVVKEETLKAMSEVFGEDKVFVLNLGGAKEEDSWVGLTGDLPDLEGWKGQLPSELCCHVDMWSPYKYIRERLNNKRL
ncbi:S-adenosyl-L-methionine-dependent methyltransferases superfamily protein [Rhynchospora pubera]|uniref:S-adenosyl-L-methionine-dependent methyltransferases superfamily protein n=1 Tax=Rhynchospora pubera TaxID=906938 RepID=A0AAV8DT54_9POAL|nr:S-adenosyl-L-methionine-dependent methyltransferases superfamily protein [Rhynchospora pubera]